jgi:hypothetical protein
MLLRLDLARNSSSAINILMHYSTGGNEGRHAEVIIILARKPHINRLTVIKPAHDARKKCSLRMKMAAGR